MKIKFILLLSLLLPLAGCGSDKIIYGSVWHYGEQLCLNNKGLASIQWQYETYYTVTCTNGAHFTVASKSHINGSDTDLHIMGRE